MATGSTKAMGVRCTNWIDAIFNPSFRWRYPHIWILKPIGLGRF